MDMNSQDFIDVPGEKNPGSPGVNGFPLSFAQERLWFLEQLTEQSKGYIIPMAFHIKGPLEAEKLEQALNEIIRRHEILRTTFRMDDMRPVQVIARHLFLALPVIDLRHFSRDEQFARVDEITLETTWEPMDLEKGPLLHLKLLLLGEKEHVLLIIVHHIIIDGWSMRLLFLEMARVYNALVKGKPIPLEEVAIQYKEYASRQRQWLASQELDIQLDYWRRQLSGAPGLLELPGDYPRPPVQTHQGKRIYFEISQAITVKLQALRSSAGTSLFMTLLAVFASLLYRYSNQEDILIGTPISSRNQKELEFSLGLFINILALRIDFSKNPSFIKLQEQVRKVALDAYSNQDVPFEMLVEQLETERSLSYHPIFQVMFVLQNLSEEVLNLRQLFVRTWDLPRSAVRYDLQLSIMKKGEALKGTLDYRTDLFDERTIWRMKEHFLILLEGITTNPGTPIAALPLITKTERRKLLEIFNETELEYPKDKTIYELFEEQVVKTPDYITSVGMAARKWETESGDAMKPAPLSDLNQITYKELNNRSRQLAYVLGEKGVTPINNNIIGIMVNRSLEMIIGLMGILKAGGAYLPIDAQYPRTRIDYMLVTSGVKILVTTRSLAKEGKKAGMGTWAGEKIFLEEQLESCILKPETINRQRLTCDKQKAASLAYVIYTSGSTGKPKGVAIRHQSAVNFIKGMTSIFNFSPGQRILALTTLSFDMSLSETLLPMACGMVVIIATEHQKRDPALLRELIDAIPVNVLQVTPTWLQLWLNYDEDLRYLEGIGDLLVGGEPFPVNLLKLFQKKFRGKIYNMYGPTEATVYASTKDLTSTAPADITIGRPFANTKIYIIDRDYQLQPIGISGELLIGGAGMAAGYINNPGLTAEKFVFSPRSCQLSACSYIYKTGDHARWLVNGEIQFLGRLDFQVKVRGFRIELKEIEMQLLKHDSIRDAVVIARQHPGHKTGNNAGTETYLTAYIVPGKVPGQGRPDTDENEFDASSLSDYLALYLPGYMIPAYFVPLEAIPLTPGGKVDRKALAGLQGQKLETGAAYVAPKTGVEQMIADTWKEILHIEKVGIHDNFFKLGGNSMKVILLGQKLNRLFEKEISITMLFRNLTISYLARYFGEEEATVDPEQELKQAEALDDARNTFKDTIKKMIGD